MPSCNEMEAHVGVALARMEHAKGLAMEVFDNIIPGFPDKQELGDWGLNIYRAESDLALAAGELRRLRKLISDMIAERVKDETKSQSKVGS